MVHLESTPHIYHVLQLIQKYNVKAGIVINPGTPVDALKAVLPIVQQVLVMTVNPGFGGQEFLETTLSKITHLDQLRQVEADYDFEIEVDGGINDQTIKSTADAGADIFVAGSYVFSANTPGQQIQTLRNLIE
ncbi:ribulose-phosphate 3-epimerase [Agrilactobacillus composti DSM 18527 = JCM 14202]|nr:ribulose-phosphate 3-epimerase [Agrilactobacillus composti DSM 18527 = JCM 14202]